MTRVAGVCDNFFNFILLLCNELTFRSSVYLAHNTPTVHLLHSTHYCIPPLLLTLPGIEVLDGRKLGPSDVL